MPEQATEVVEAKDMKTKEYVPMGILSFKDFDSYKTANDAAKAVAEDTETFMQLVYNNLYSDTVTDKRSALLGLVNEYGTRLGSDSVSKEVTQDPEQKEDHPFLLVKEANGQYRWFAIYSNNLRDDDYPPEIISAKSHRTFTELATKGLVPMPELWQWHLPGTRWGVADSLFYGDDGFALATGLVDPGKEHVAEAMQATKEVLVSHGMPRRTILRNPDDPSVIDFHITKEISTLPGHRAANKLTGFALMNYKEQSMLDEARRSWLKSAGYKDEEIAHIESSLATKAADAAERESKEATEATTEVATEAVETSIVAPAETATPVAEETTPEQTMNVKELIEAVSAVIKPLSDQVVALTQEVAKVKEAQTTQAAELNVKARQMVAETPQMSMRELLAVGVFGQQAVVDGRSALAKDAPVQKEANDGVADVTGIPFINQLFTNALAKGVQ